MLSVMGVFPRSIVATVVSNLHSCYALHMMVEPMLLGNTHQVSYSSCTLIACECLLLKKHTVSLIIRRHY